MTRIFLLALTILTTSLLAAAPRTVIVFGDSITAGSALPADQREKVWVKVVEAQSKGELIMINEGKGGRPTASVPEFEAMLLRHPKADLLVIALGMNDSRDITEACVPKAVANVRTMMEKARKTYGDKLPVLLVGPSNINKAALGPTKPIGDQREAKLRELGAAFEKLGTEWRAGFISLFGVIPESSLLKDGVHPDAAGNEAIAKVLEAKLQTVGAVTKPEVRK